MSLQPEPRAVRCRFRPAANTLKLAECERQGIVAPRELVRGAAMRAWLQVSRWPFVVVIAAMVECAAGTSLWLPRAAAADAPLSIAVMVSSDKNRCYDPGVVRAIKSFTTEAAERYNSEAPADAPRLAIRFFDDFEAADAATDNMRLAIADPRLVGIIGLSSSSRAKAVIDSLGGDLRTAGIPFVSDISLDALFSAQPSIYSMATTVGNEVAVVKRLLKDRGSVRPMFVGLAGDDYSEALGNGLAGPPDAVSFISSQRLLLAGNALDKAAVAALVQSIRQSPPDLLLLAIQSGPAAQLVKALLTAKVDVPVFVLYGRAKRILDLVGSPPPASEMLELGRDGVPNVANERLRQMIWQGRGRDWVFDDLPNKDATGWKDGSCTLTTGAAPLKLMDDRNRRAIGRGAQYADLVTLFGAVVAGVSDEAPVAEARAALLVRLSALSSGVEMQRGLWQDWSFSARRVSNDNPIILRRPPGGGPLLLASIQYQHDGRDLVSTPVLFMSLDPISLLRINTDEETFEAEFYLSIRTEDRAIGIADIEFTNAFRSSTSQQPLISWREINDGSRVTRFPPGTRIYKVSGKFGFEAKLQNYPFDSQRLSISFQPVSASRPFIIQPVDPAATGARAEIDGWDIEENYVGTDQDVIPTLDVHSGAKTIVTFYKFNQTFMVKRQAVDFYLRVLIPLIFILLVSWFSVFLASDRFDSIMAIQVTALLSAIALYLALPQVDSGEATLSDRTFVATYAAVSLMIGLSVLQDRLTPRWPLIGRLVFGVQAVIFPLLLIGVFGWLLASGR